MKHPFLLLLCAAITLASCKKEDDAPASPSVPTPASDPISVRLDAITLTGFNPTDENGNYWDGSDATNPPDPEVRVYKSNVLLYTSTIATNANPMVHHSMNTAASGALPIGYADGNSLRIELWDHDGGPYYQYMGQVYISNALSFFYGGDHTAGFTDLQVTGNNGITFLLTGTFIY